MRGFLSQLGTEVATIEGIKPLKEVLDFYNNKEDLLLNISKYKTQIAGDKYKIQQLESQIKARDELLREAIAFLPTEYVNRDEWKYKTKAILKESEG